MSKSLPLKVFKEVVGGNTNDAEVLKEIWHWVTFAREKLGQDWYARPRAAIASNLGLSLDKVERSLHRLRRDQLLFSGQHLLGGKNICHFRLTTRCHEAVLAAQEGKPGAGHAPGELAAPMGATVAAHEAGKSAGLNNTISYSSSYTVSYGEPSGPQEDSGSEKKVSGENEKMGNMKEQLQLGKAKTEAYMHKPGTSAALAHVWKKHVSEKYGVTVGLKKQESGQLGQLTKLWPEGKSEAILVDVLTHWVNFVKKVESETECKSTPIQPHCGFLLKYATIAAIYAQSLHLTATPKGQEAPEAKPAQTPSTEETPASYEEVLAILKGK